jgi:hypothetical protein
MRIHWRENDTRFRLLMMMTQCSTRRADQCILRRDISPGMGQVQMAKKEIILFITTLGRVAGTNHGQNFASIRDSHCHHYRDIRICGCALWQLFH